LSKVANITRLLAENVTSVACQPLDANVATMAQLSLLNVLGTAIGASGEPAVSAVVTLGIRHGGPRTVPIPGRGTRLDPLRGATAIGLAAHLDDFDDTHLATVIHPGAAALAASLAVGVPAAVTGDKFLTAFALGCEVQLRLGVTMSPWHYDQGWHITGTVAPIGAAVTAALLGGADVDVLERAISVAAQMTLGHREGFGSMIKPFHPGKGAANGVLAAALASGGCSGPDDALARYGGYFPVLSTRYEPERLNRDFGANWELSSNTFKPYPCGIVCHPAIDAALSLSAPVNQHLDRIETITVHCHPLVAELTGNPQPQTGLQARFSTIHGVAAGIADGVVALPQYADVRVMARDLIRLRSLTRLMVDPGRARDSSRVELTLSDGQVVSEEVVHARGSLERPMSYEELMGKVTGLVEPVLPGSTPAIAQAVMGMGALENLEPLLEPLIASDDEHADVRLAGADR